MKSSIAGTLALICCLVAQGNAHAQSASDVAKLGEQAIERLQQYIRVDTVNPPGNEINGARFLAAILEAEGVGYDIVESSPGRGNLWARLEGGDEPGIILLHHIDVVPADHEYWSVDPFAGEIRGDYLYGRGAVDTKGSGIAHLQAFLALHRSKAPLRRDVVFMATADEEAGGFHGAGWLIENRPELFKDIGFVINEGGIGRISGSGQQLRRSFNVEVTQKVPLWLRLVSVDTPGHGSMPRATSAVTRLVHALARIDHSGFAPRLVAPVDAYFKARADEFDEPLRARFNNMAAAVKDPQFLVDLQKSYPGMHALTRNTCSMTMLSGSKKINVVPPQASAQLDCRLLPDQDPDEFVAALRALIADDAIDVERIMGFSPAISSTDTGLYRAIRRATAREYHGSALIPAVAGGFTDSHFFRDIGIVAYGFVPALLERGELVRIHGNDERISLDNIRLSTRIMLALMEDFVY